MIEWIKGMLVFQPKRLVQLNAERAAEETAGHVRWLRPEYQAPEEAKVVKQGKLLEVEVDTAEAQKAERTFVSRSSSCLKLFSS